MNYQINISAVAERDLIRSADYIEFTLKNPNAANHLLHTATKQIQSLSQFPERFQLVNDPILSAWGIRFITVNNYMAFYTVDKSTRTVTVVRFLYKQSNWRLILHQSSYPSN